MLNTISNEYVTIKEAADVSIFSKKQIFKLAEKGNQRIRTKISEDNQDVLYNKLDIIQYAASHPRDIILDTVWDEIDIIDGETFYILRGYDCKYFVSNMGRVINATNGQVLTPQLRGKDGYKQITLMKHGKKKAEYLHRLVAFTQCPNVLRKDIVHHIRISIPSNDKASNLVYVWKHQHDELHRLLRERKTQEYTAMIKAIKKENCQKLYRIPHLDYKSDDIFIYYMLVTKKGYTAYKHGQDVPLDCIIMEFAEMAKDTKGIDKTV